MPSRARRHRDSLVDATELQLPAAGIGHDLVAVVELATKQLDCQGLDDLLLDRALQGPRAVDRVEAFDGEEFLGRVGEFELDLAVGEPLTDFGQLDVDDGLDLFLAQRVEDDDVVDAVEQLRSEALPDESITRSRVRSRAASRSARSTTPPPLDRKGVEEMLAPEVAGHDDDRVLEVDGPALGVRQPPVVEQLQQDVEHLRVCLLDLVEQDHGVRPTTDGLGQLARFVVADIAGWGADQA